EADDGNLNPAEQPAGQDAAVTRYHPEVGVDQHRDDKSEGLDAARDLADLSGAMRARVLGIELELGDRMIGYLTSAPGLIAAPRMSLGGPSLHQRFQSSQMSVGRSSRPRSPRSNNPIDLMFASTIF